MDPRWPGDRARDPLWAWLLRSRGLSAVALGLVVVLGVITQIGLMVTSGRVVQALVDTGGATAVRPVLMFGSLSVLIGTLSWARTLLTERLTWRYLQGVEVALATASLRPQTIAHLEDQEARGAMAMSAEALREGVHQRAIGALVDLWATRLAGVGSAALLINFHWWAPLILLTGYLLLIRGYRIWLSTIVDDLSGESAEARRRAEYYRSLLGDPSAAKEVRVFALTPWLDDRFATTWTTAMRAVWANRGRSVGPVMIGGTALLIALGAVLSVLGYEAVNGMLPVGGILIFVQAIAGMDALSYQGESAWHVSRARDELGKLDQLTGRLDRLAAEDQSQAVELRPRTEAEHQPGAPAAVSLRAVTFSYPGSTTPVLRDLDLEMAAGESIAIVGANGAGKSTLMKLLCGVYQPASGQVLIDGERARADQGRVAAIFQSFGRYEVSLADNVAFGDLSRTDDAQAIRDQLARAGGSAIVEQVGLDTMLSANYPGGSDLSGGQWQRVALARALMSASSGRAGLLILDEPTAALDVRAEVELFDRFLEVTDAQTTVLVSHRLSGVRRADRIIVLADGAVAEDGTHDELMIANGPYATMFRLQAERFQDSGDRDA